MSTVETPQQEEFKFVFRLKSGSHCDRKSGKILEPGALLHTNENMIKLHGGKRWELVQQGKESVDDLKNRIKALEARLSPAKAEPQEDELERKSIKELRAMALDMQPPVDLATCTSKPEIINAIRQALDAA